MKDMESINDGDIATSIKPMDKSQKEDIKKREYKLVYKNLVMFGYFHLAGLYGLYLCFTSAKWQTIIFSVVFYMLSIIGITAGSHRLWAHRTYKAKMPLQIILMILNCIAFQSIIIQWARDHRLHHKYTDTDVDPHNAKRGFFYSHIGWLLVRKLPEVKKYGREIDLSDLYNNPVLKFQERYAVPLIGFSCFVLPTIMPMYFWGENLNTAYHMCMFRYITNLNATFMVNSAAHMWGYKPYDKSIMPSHNFAIILTTLGEGFHNYHHVFPWDYRAAEFGNNKLNLTTMFIDFFARIGWAYDLKTVPEDMIRRRAKKTGDGTNLWGFEDKDISSEDKNYVSIIH